ncbi:adenosylcobinamide-GDP ribazoletransferase [Desulfitispora alkaliphila]|uniref:adenosylcobinamide-GDP ribazoletransferase n=1 Tax=Desulfitispora alkaliphila TaxID=622674 RepID=UPI003D2092C3
MINFLLALQFLTRIQLGNINFDPNKHSFAKSILYFPLVGLIIGVIFYGYVTITGAYIDQLVVASLFIVLSIYITGGLHLDGFMDTMDGVLSGREREKILEIMKDSRVGAHSVTAVIPLLIVKFSLIASMPIVYLPVAVLLMPLIARYGIVVSMLCWPYARNQGLGKLFVGGNKNIVLLVTTIFTLVLTYAVLNTVGIILFAITMVAVLIMNFKISKKLSGLTGDTYGAVCELTEVLFLLFFYILIRVI